MAYTVKRRPEKVARAAPSVIDKLRASDKLPHASESVREGAAEVKEKLRSDLTRLSQLARMRRSVSLKPMVVCLDCGGSGKTECLACGGAGTHNVVLHDEPQQCSSCSGSGLVTCAECDGRGIVRNIHRKKVLWVLGVGGAAWAYVLFRLWGGDVLPEQRAKLLSGGGGGGTGRAAAAEQPHHLGEPGGAKAAGAASGAGAGSGRGADPRANAAPGAMRPPGAGLSPGAMSGTGASGR